MLLMNMKHKSLISGVIVSIFILSIVAVSQYATAADTSLSDVIAAGKLVVGMEVGYPPFEDRNETDDIVGFDPDIIEYVAADIGVTVEYKDVAWSTIFTSLGEGQFDCVCSAVSITVDRKASMDFSRWYFLSTQAAMVTLANPKSIEDHLDANDTTVKVGFQADTTSQLYFEDNNFVATPVSFATITLAVEALNTGTVDVVFGDYATLIAGQEVNPGNFEIVDTFSPEPFGIPCQKGAKALVARIDQALGELLGTDPYNPVYSTFYNETHVEWIGGLPETPGLAELKAVLDALIVEEPKPTISGASIFGLIAVIPFTSYFIIRKLRKQQ
jgi:polar amino acid transport system substrate-binding protein